MLIVTLCMSSFSIVLGLKIKFNIIEQVSYFQIKHDSIVNCVNATPLTHLQGEERQLRVKCLAKGTNMTTETSLKPLNFRMIV